MMKKKNKWIILLKNISIKIFVWLDKAQSSESNILFPEWILGY